MVKKESKLVLMTRQISIDHYSCGHFCMDMCTGGEHVGLEAEASAKIDTVNGGRLKLVEGGTRHGDLTV